MKKIILLLLIFAHFNTKAQISVKTMEKGEIVFLNKKEFTGSRKEALSSEKTKISQPSNEKIMICKIDHVLDSRDPNAESLEKTLEGRIVFVKYSDGLWRLIHCHTYSYNSGCSGFDENDPSGIIIDASIEGDFLNMKFQDPETHKIEFKKISL